MIAEDCRRDGWWTARPDGTCLVGLVVARDGLPSVADQRAELARFGVPIDGFRHPAPEALESWCDRLTRLTGTLQRGDVLVVATVEALGRDLPDSLEVLAGLRRHGVIVKVLGDRGRVQG